MQELAIVIADTGSRVKYENFVGLCALYVTRMRNNPTPQMAQSTIGSACSSIGAPSPGSSYLHVIIRIT